MRSFVPFDKIGDRKAIVVDALHPKALVLSHWKGGNIHPKIEADTSGEIVLNALEQNIDGINTEVVTANHFDIDGFVGVFALIYPEYAAKYREVLKEMATIGDFREYDPNNSASVHAAKLCCWMNSRERENFYRPFGEKDEMKICENKFLYFLKIFPKVIEDTERFKSDWLEEFSLIEQGIAHIKSNSELVKRKDLGLLIQFSKQPQHYYAQFSNSIGFDTVLSIYDNHRYELEYKYTTWVDIASRSSFPRINLKPLAKQLNHIEKSTYLWEVDQITDTGPILRLEKNKISKADRYDSPSKRSIYSSSIPSDLFVELVTTYLEKAYQNIHPKRFWSWDEIRSVNRAFMANNS